MMSLRPFSAGSSPQARGTHAADDGQDVQHRLIPTGAGNTSAGKRNQSERAAHPHRRGEHRQSKIAAAIFDGSSPQARGTPEDATSAPPPPRLVNCGQGGGSRRGEHCTPTASLSSTDGSSPQARGTLLTERPSPSARRLIPTGAGNTCCWSPTGCTTPAHPHRRGEHAVCAAVSPSMDGSSPQARGTHGISRVADWLHRLIPTGAGNTG